MQVLVVVNVFQSHLYTSDIQKMSLQVVVYTPQRDGNLSPSMKPLRLSSVAGFLWDVGFRRLKASPVGCVSAGA